jgi:hypothetical protein
MMRRFGLVVLALAGGGACVAFASGSDNASDMQATARAAEVRVPWIVLGTGPGARALVIRYQAASCHRGPAHAFVSETSKAIRIRVRQPVSGAEACSRVGFTPRLTVRLADPVAGRSIQGEGLGYEPRRGLVESRSLSVPDRPNPAVRLPLVPRVVGLSSEDAAAVLERQGFHVTVDGASGEVVAQEPAPRHRAPGSSRTAPYDGVVRITTG